MKTQRRLAEILKATMAETPLDEISVSSLATKAGINRKTFYYHFHDVYDLLTLVFLSEKVEKITKTTNPHEVFEAIYTYYTKNEKFVVVKGKGLIQLRKIGTDKIVEFEVNGDEITVVDMIPGYTHNIINLSDTEDLVTFMWCNECFNPDKPDTFFEEV